VPLRGFYDYPEGIEELWKWPVETRLTNMKRWKVTVTMESTLPSHVDDGGAEVDTVWLKAGDELAAVESVIQNMRSDDRWVKVTKITVEPTEA
jgi:hypothetical protein